MKILVIGNFSFSEYGGAKTVANYLIEGYKKAGHEVTAISFPKTEGILAKVFSQFLDVLNPKAVISLKKIMRKNSPDVVHLHNVHRDLSAYSARVISRMNIPVVITLHESWALCSNFNLTSGKDGKLKCRKSKSRFEIPFFGRRSLIRKFLSSAGYIFVPSEFSRKTFLKIGGYNPDKVISVHNGVDTRIFVPQNKESYKNMLNVIFVGRPTAKKGINWLKDAVALITEENRDLKINLRIVGGQENVSHENLPAHYQNADVLVQPSLVHETFGLTLAEAMACGIPVITSNMGAMPEVAGEAGIIVEPGNTVALKRTLVDLAADIGKRTKLGLLGRKRAETFFDSGLMCRRYLDYIEILTGKH